MKGIRPSDVARLDDHSDTTLVSSPDHNPYEERADKYIDIRAEDFRQCRGARKTRRKNFQNNYSVDKRVEMVRALLSIL